jgi:curved DNA-binding protein CbpA
VETPKTFRIDRGIGQYDFNDYYAVLGLPITAEAAHVRKRYLMIAKSLHPDIHGRSCDEKEVATQYLSKLVNPAYNVLSQERERTEYSAILKLLGKRLMKRNQKFAPQSEIAKKYLASSKDINYEQTVTEIAKVQYQNLDQAIENIGLLSELNLVHILIHEGYKHLLNESENLIIISNNSINKNTNITNNPNTSYQMRSEAQSPPRHSSYDSNSFTKNSNQNIGSNNIPNASIEQCILQAENYINQQLWASALKELRSAIQIDCNSSKSHALLGFVYLNQKLLGMAKVSFQQSLKLNPEEPLALKYISQVGGTPIKGENSQSKAKDNKKGGFFGWLGGG